MTTTLRRKKRDMSQCVMSVLECLKDQQYDEGVMKQDLMYRCGLNFHYMEQIMNYLIVNGLTYKSSTQPSYRKNSFRYFLTEKGFKFWADLAASRTGRLQGGIKWFKENTERPLLK